MAISRRAFGVGLVGAIVATGGYLFLREHPEIAGRFGEPKKLFGFAGGEKEGFLINVRVRELLERRFGLVLDARRAGSVEMVLERALLDQHPQFLWPSSSVLVEVAHSSGLKLSRDQVIFSSPIVLYSWDQIADGLVKGGFAQHAGGPRYTIDLEKLLRAIIAGESWATLGVPDLRTRARRPDRSFQIQFGFHVCRSRGEPAQRRCSDARNPETGRWGCRHDLQTDGLQAVLIGQVVRRLHRGGAAAQPLVVGYETSSLNG